MQRHSTRQTLKAGEKGFVDYAAQTVPVVSPNTGEICEAQLFVAVLAASNFTYAEASLSQYLPDWLVNHIRAFEYCGGATAIVVPHSVQESEPSWHNPGPNPSTYRGLPEYYYGYTTSSAGYTTPSAACHVL